MNSWAWILCPKIIVFFISQGFFLVNSNWITCLRPSYQGIGGWPLLPSMSTILDPGTSFYYWKLFFSWVNALTILYSDSSLKSSSTTYWRTGLSSFELSYKRFRCTLRHSKAWTRVCCLFGYNLGSTGSTLAIRMGLPNGSRIWAGRHWMLGTRKWGSMGHRCWKRHSKSFWTASKQKDLVNWFL